MSERIRTALFLDFDNVFSGLLALDRAAAKAFTDEPRRWLERMRTVGLEPDAHRDLLVKGAYMNPNGFIIDKELGNSSGRLYLSTFRPNLTKAGFEVIDCPALTTRQKNAADIRIVIDVLTAMNATTRYDEVAIASSDADFTPLLQRLKADDRRTTIISSGSTSPAYQSVADLYLDEVALIAMIRPPATKDDSLQHDDAAASVASLIRKLVKEASAPIYLSNVGEQAHQDSASVAETSWFGFGNMAAFIRGLNDPDLEFDNDFIWDSSRHSAPSSQEPGDSRLPPLVDHVCRVTDLPRLHATSWPLMFETLAEYVATHTFALGELTAWTRDKLLEAGTPVGRGAISYAVKAAASNGTRLDSEPPPTGLEIFDALARTVIDRAQAGGLTLSDEDVKELRQWLWPGLQRPEAPEPESVMSRHPPQSLGG